MESFITVTSFVLQVVSTLLAILGVIFILRPRLAGAAVEWFDASDRRSGWRVPLAILGLAAILLAFGLWVGPKYQQRSIERLAAKRDFGGEILFVEANSDMYPDEKASTNVFVCDPKGQDLRPLTYAIDDSAPDYSPDGNMFAFVSSDGGAEPGIATMSRGGANRRFFESTVIAECESPEWSPAGDAILYEGQLSGRKAIYRLDVASGSTEVVLESATYEYEDPAYSPDGRLVAVCRVDGLRSVLRLYDAQTLEYVGGARADSGVRFTNPDFSPDGETIAVVASHDADTSSSIELIAVNSLFGDASEYWQGTTIDTTQRRVAHPKYSVDGDRIAFLAAEDGEWHLFVRDLASGIERRVTSELTGSMDWLVTSGEEYLAYSVLRQGTLEIVEEHAATGHQEMQTTNGVWYYDPSANASGSAIACGVRRYDPFTEEWTWGIEILAGAGQSVPITVDEPGRESCFSPSWSLTGNLLAFHAFGSGQSADVFTMDWPEGTPVQRTDGTRAYISPTWLPDGEGLAALVSMPDREVALVSLDGRTAPIDALTSNDCDESDPAVSPDGDWIAYSSMAEGFRDESGDEPLAQIYVVSVDGGDPVRLTDPASGYSYDHPSWSPNGDAIVVSAQQEGTDESGNELRVLVLGRRLLTRQMFVAGEYFLSNGLDPSWSRMPVSF